MPTAAQTEAINQFVAQPINNLIVFLAIVSLVIVLAGLFVIWKFAPLLYNLYKQQADTNKQNAETNAKLTIILGENEKRATERTVALNSLGDKTDKQTETLTAIGEKTDHQTEVLDHQTEVLEAVGKTFSDHHIATAETVANLSDKVDSLETVVSTNTESIAALTEQIRNLVNKLEDKAACADAEERMRKLRDEILDKLSIEQAKRATDSQPIVVITPSNVIPDSGAGATGEAA